MWVCSLFKKDKSGLSMTRVKRLETDRHAQTAVTQTDMERERGVTANRVARTLKRLRTSNGDYFIKQLFSTIMSL